MKLLIAYASAGTGHKHSAEALYAYIKKYHKEIDVQIKDILSFTTPIFNFVYSFGYNFVARNTPKLWGFFYNISGNSTSLFISNKIRFLINRTNDNKFVRFLEKEQFDVILSTHFFPSEIACILKKQKEIKSLLISIITDFAVHPFWVNKEIDKYIVALPEAKNDLIREGIPEYKIKILGIPINEAFLLKKDRLAVAKNLGVDISKFTVLIVVGSIGTGPIEKIIDLLDMDTQALVICGRNVRLFKELKLKNYKNAIIYDYVNNMDELMSVSDIIITKAGGITISESIAKNLPAIFIPIIGGQEFYNAEILAKYNACFTVKNIRALKEIISLCKRNKRVINKLKDRLLKISKPNVLKDIFDEICANHASTPA
ncbi:MAG: glycosyltransferase [Patescibacteria group bacterium]